MQSFSFDIQKTKAILIGVSDYDFLPKIAPADNNIIDMVNLLTDSNIMGLPANNIIQIINKRNDEISDEIVEFLADENNIGVETLIFYYVGHGIRGLNSRELYLTGRNSKRSTIKTSAISYDEIKQQIENSQIQTRIVLIDACHSGLAAMGADNEPYTETELDIKGSYTLTSAAGNEKAFFDTSIRNTFFTSELLRIMKHGLPMQQPFISLENVFKYLQNNLKLSNPQRKSNLNSSDFYLFRNSMFDILSMLEKEGDDLLETGEYQKALSKFLEVCIEKDSDEIRKKIEKCKEYIRVVQKDELQKETELWKTACSINTVSSYRKYINVTSVSLHNEKALQLIEQIELSEKKKKLETLLWEKARTDNLKSSYNNYLQEYPQGNFKAEAISAIEKIEETEKSNPANIVGEKVSIKVSKKSKDQLILFIKNSINSAKKKITKWLVPIVVLIIILTVGLIWWLFLKPKPEPDLNHNANFIYPDSTVRQKRMDSIRASQKRMDSIEASRKEITQPKIEPKPSFWEVKDWKTYIRDVQHKIYQQARSEGNRYIFSLSSEDNRGFTFGGLPSIIFNFCKFKNTTINFNLSIVTPPKEESDAICIGFIWNLKTKNMATGNSGDFNVLFIKGDWAKGTLTATVEERINKQFSSYASSSNTVNLNRSSVNKISIKKNGGNYSVKINNITVLEFERSDILNFTSLYWVQGTTYAIDNFTIEKTD